MKPILLSLCTFYQFTHSQPPIPLNPLPPVVDHYPIMNLFPPVVDPLPIVPELPIVDPIPLPQPPAIHPLPPLPGPNQAYGAFGQLCDIHSAALCTAPTDILSSENYIRCEQGFDCCLCASIECIDCITFISGNSGVLGVGAIAIHGQDVHNGGAQIICEGTESCSAAVITGTNINYMVVSGDMGSKNAVVTITNPAPDFILECKGLASCEGLILEIIIPAAAPGTVCDYEPFSIGGVFCNGQESCKNMDITIRNNACHKVLIDKLECTEIDACIAANFNFIGDIDVVHCDLGASGHTATGISKCYQHLQALLCQDAESCRGMVKTLTNPNNAFSLECGALGSCHNAQITIDLTPPSTSASVFRPHTSWLSGFKFGGVSSGAMATISINNAQKGKTLEIESIECVAINACAYTTFIIGRDVEIVSLICNAGTCPGCLVKIEAIDPGIACDEYTV